jgi:tRNA(Arg) A34 adenosine deaminase TadA
MAELTPDWVFSDADRAAMGMALEEARAAAEAGEVPVGAVVAGRDGALAGVQPARVGP